jgi:membrane-anchored glycerophosphoryl diester phosphodiesterase (GDPDase)
VTAYPAWTPASRPGIIPLHPLSFGTILGRSFAALRQNPRVLLGFALIVQTLAYLVVGAAVAGIAIASFVRLDTVPTGSEDFNTLMAGSVATTLIAAFVLGLAAGALGVIIQGIVVTEVAHAAVAEKLTLGALWRQVKPVAWRLIGYAALLILAIIAVVAVIAVALIAIGVTIGPAVFALVIPLVLAAIPLSLWLSTKLLLVPAAIILERATIGGALRRSWTLTRRRFWPILGVIVVISLVFGFVAQAVSVPFSLLSTGLTTIISPTADPEPSAVIGILVASILVQAFTLLIQSVAVVVQSTATSIIYIDCRMRHEGLDIDLLAYVERRDAGATDLPDPYRQHIGRTIAPRGVGGGYPSAPVYAPGYAQQPQYGQYGQQAPYPQGPYGQPRERPAPVRPAPIRSGTLRPARVRAAPARAGSAGHRAGAGRPSRRRRADRRRVADHVGGPRYAYRRRRRHRPRVAVGVSLPHAHGLVGAVAARFSDTVPPLTPDGDEARRWAENELSNSIYDIAEPTPFDLVARAIAEFFANLFSIDPSGGWGSLAAVVAAVLVVAVIAVAFAVWGVPRSPRRAAAREATLFGEAEGRSASQLRAAAASHARAGEWEPAIVLHFRALARGCAERGVVDVPPGATVHAFAREAARAFPSLSDSLEDAARAFDDVRYLRRPGTVDLYRQVSDTDAAVVSARPAISRGVPA